MLNSNLESQTYTVKSRSTGGVSYNLPDLMIRREFSPGEVKRGVITGKELESLSFIPGGLKLMQKYLVVPQEIAEELGLNVEPEYFYDENDVRTLLESGSYDQFLDCLDFAPGGVIDLIKKLAVEMNLNDMRKRDAILKATGFDVTRAISNNEYANGPDEEDTTEKVRRTAASLAENAKPQGQAPTRRSNYNVTSRG